MNDETLVTDDHITINSSTSEGNENVNDIRPANKGEGDTTLSNTIIGLLIIENFDSDGMTYVHFFKRTSIQ